VPCGYKFNGKWIAVVGHAVKPKKLPSYLFTIYLEGVKFIWRYKKSPELNLTVRML
jgi:hypothetical protein